MNKKSMLMMCLYLVVGGIVGAFASFGLIALTGDGTLEFFQELRSTFIEISIYLYIGLFVCVFLPAVALINKGKKIMSKLGEVDDEAYDKSQDKADKFMNNGSTLGQVFMVLNFMLIGLTFEASRQLVVVVLILFMINAISSSVLEITTIKFIQKHDKRLKGDPTSLKFGKDFLESLDEAEKLIIYKAGYKAFQFSRFSGLALLMITILIKFIFEEGDSAILVLGILMMIQVISFNIYSRKVSGRNTSKLI